MKYKVLAFTVGNSYLNRPRSSAGVRNVHILSVTILVIMHFIRATSRVLVAQDVVNLKLRDAMLKGTSDDSIAFYQLRGPV